MTLSGTRSYKGVSHDAVTQVLHMPMAEAGIMMKATQIHVMNTEKELTKVWNGQETKTTQYISSVVMRLELINVDDPKDRESFQFEAISFDSGDKAIGKATSMAVKNGLLKIFMLESLDQEEERANEDSTYHQTFKPQIANKLKDEPKANPSPAFQPANKPSNAAGPTKINQIYSLAKKNNWDEAGLKKCLQFCFNAKSVNNLNDNQYNQLTKILRDGNTVDQALLIPCEVCK